MSAFWHFYISSVISKGIQDSSGVLYKVSQSPLSEGHNINSFKPTNELEISKLFKWVSFEEKQWERGRENTLNRFTLVQSQIPHLSFWWAILFSLLLAQFLGKSPQNQLQNGPAATENDETFQNLQNKMICEHNHPNNISQFYLQFLLFLFPW